MNQQELEGLKRDEERADLEVRQAFEKLGKGIEVLTYPPIVQQLYGERWDRVDCLRLYEVFGHLYPSHFSELPRK